MPAIPGIASRAPFRVHAGAGVFRPALRNSTGTAVIERPAKLARAWGSGLRIGVALALLAAACSLPAPAPLPPDSFAFGVFGDGPYRGWETGRFRRLLADVEAARVAWLLHVGDILWYPCSDQAFADRLAALNTLQAPVVYTPGDNEWADCHEPIAGEYAPLDRLSRLRSMFFVDPQHSVGGRPMRVESQNGDSMFTEFIENARWRRGGFLFVTMHITGSGNASDPFEGRSPADDAEVERRTAAALAWMDEAFDIARAESLSGIVMAIHGNPGLEREAGPRVGYDAFVDRLEEHVREFAASVLFIHGDSHTQRVDQPLTSRVTGEILSNFTRLETYGSPDIGWVRVVIDSVAGRVVAFEPRLTRWWWLW